MDDSEFEPQPTGPSSGARTPMAYVNKAQKNARHVFNKVGDVAGKVAGDFTGQAVKSSTHPHQVYVHLNSCCEYSTNLPQHSPIIKFNDWLSSTCPSIISYICS